MQRARAARSSGMSHLLSMSPSPSSGGIYQVKDAFGEALVQVQDSIIQDRGALMQCSRYLLTAAVGGKSRDELKGLQGAFGQAWAQGKWDTLPW